MFDRRAFYCYIVAINTAEQHIAKTPHPERGVVHQDGKLFSGVQ
jgi:hypothetical protein